MRIRIHSPAAGSTLLYVLYFRNPRIKMYLILVHFTTEDFLFNIEHLATVSM